MAHANLDWMDDSACLSMDADLFFSGGYGSGRSAESEFRKKAAKQVCERECPVRMECLVDAFRNEDRHGIRGGYTERERRRMLREHLEQKQAAARTA